MIENRIVNHFRMYIQKAMLIAQETHDTTPKLTKFDKCKSEYNSQNIIS
jgi:hypothetical protein